MSDHITSAKESLKKYNQRAVPVYLDVAQTHTLLSIAESLEALVEASKPKGELPLVPMAYALTRKMEGRDHAEVMSIYTEQDAAMNEAASLNKIAKDMGSAVTWGVSPYIRK